MISGRKNSWDPWNSRLEGSVGEEDWLLGHMTALAQTSENMSSMVYPCKDDLVKRHLWTLGISWEPFEQGTLQSCY